MNNTTPPDRLSVDPASKFFDASQLERGIHVFLDGKEYFDVEEYCKKRRLDPTPRRQGKNSHRATGYDYKERGM